MSDRQKPPTEFDAYAGDYAELIRDPIRVKFAASNRFFFERKLQVIQAFYQKSGLNTRDLTWLDAGCGQGDLLRVGHSCFKSATGCDPSEGMLKSSLDFEVKHQISDDKLPFEDSSFDFITAVCVYHHVPEERRLALTMEIKRLLKPRGVMCIMEHNPLNPVTRLIVSRTSVDADAHLLRLSVASQLMVSAGTKILHSTYFLFFPQALYRPLASIESALSSIPLGGQYAIFAQK